MAINKKKSKKLKCFITAPPQSNISVITEILNSLGIEVLNDVHPAGTDMLSSVAKWLKRADFVVGVIEDSFSNFSFFEMGYAIGSGKPLLVVASPKIVLPVSLKGFFHIPARSDDVEALRFNLPLFIKALDYSAPQAVIEAETARHPTIIKGTQQNLNERLSDPLEKAARVETQLARLLQATGATVVEQGTDDVLRADIVAWLPNLPLDFGNPIVFEVKSRLTTRSVDEFEPQMSRYFLMPGVRTVILVHTGNNADQIQRKLDGFLIYLGFERLKTALLSGSLPKLLAQLRSNYAHGSL